jgi:hypothetical protein
MTGATPPDHGTRARYSHRDPELRCRCAVCAKANSDYQAGYRQAGYRPTSQVAVCPTCGRAHTVSIERASS